MAATVAERKPNRNDIGSTPGTRVGGNYRGTSRRLCRRLSGGVMATLTGALVGDALGAVVGAGLGSSLGVVLGASEGAGLGSDEGKALGTTDGASVSKGSMALSGSCSSPSV